MFDIFVKRKKIVVDFFTSDPHIYAYSKPVAATKVLPQWFVNTPSSYLVEDERLDMPLRENTIKKCPGIIDLYSNSIAMTCWFDGELAIHPHGNIDFRTGRGNAALTEHDRKQYGNFVKGTAARQLKLQSQWAIRCNRDIRFMLTEPTWHNHETYSSISVLPGLIRPKYDWSTNINFITRPSSETKSIFFEPGDPLCFLTPVTQEKFTIKSHLVSDAEAVRIGVASVKWGLFHSSDQKRTYGASYHRRIKDKLKNIHGEEK